MSSELLTRVIDRYLKSGDFNGLYIDRSDLAERDEAIALTKEGLLQVVSEEDYPNPHIRPWPSRRTLDNQLRSLEALDDATYGVCLYPTPLGLSKSRRRKNFPDEPYREAMAKGRGTLELAYFAFDVLEIYRNDPRYTFQFDDFGASAVVSDDVYEDEDEPETDKILMGHIGFAYDLSAYDHSNTSSPIVRRVCGFYGDLAKLSPPHQQRWRSYEVDADDNLKPHPMWWASQMGHWPDGFGPFQQLINELELLKELTERAHGVPFIGTAERPRELGWLLRPSQHEFDAFIQLLDKLLSENLQHDALDRMGVPRLDDEGKPIGTLNRLDRFLERCKVDRAVIEEVLKPLRDVRRARQRPAHALRTNVTNKTFINKQADVMSDVVESMWQLRTFWETHPANRAWQEPEYMKDAVRYRL